MRPHRLLLPIPLLAACSTADADVDALDPGRPGEAEGRGEPEVIAAAGSPVGSALDACEGAPMIGILDVPGASCTLGNTLPPGWAGQRMFDDGTPGLAALSLPVPHELARYCRFEIDDPTLADPAQLHAAVTTFPAMDASTLGPDCRGQAVQGDGLADPTVTNAMRQAFRDNIDHVSAATLAPFEAGRTRVDVMVTDTVSKAAAQIPTIVPTNEHGLYMASIIEDIACPGGTAGCAIDIRHTLAMPRNDWSSPPSYLEGGEHGTPGDLAMAIYEAVALWQESHVDEEPDAAPRLVMELSLGYTRYLEDTGFEGRGPARAVVAALQHAACQGALVIAATGNAPQQACPGKHEGPLAPASLETHVAPSLAQCNASGSTPTLDPSVLPTFPPAGITRPLVYGVSGVDERDLPLGNARVGSRSRQAALGSNAVVEAGSSFANLTGSSVSTATVTATAALLWSFRAGLRPDEVMEEIHASGYPLLDDAGQPIAADFGPAAQAPQDVRRLSVCAALDAACTGAASCPDLGGCQAQAPAADGNLGSFFAAVDAVMTSPSTAVDSLVGPDPQAPECVPVVPDNLHDPQPDLPVCARCNLSVEAATSTKDDALRMTIEGEYAGTNAIQQVWLYVRDDAGTSEHDLSGAVSSLNAQGSELVDVTEVMLAVPSGAHSAMLIFDLYFADEQRWSRQEQEIPVERAS